MSFGYSVGDILAISKLAWDVYNVYKDAPDDFRNISDEIKSLHIIMDNNSLRVKLQDPKMTLEERKRVQEILQGCTNVLKDSDRLLDKYKSLGSTPGSSSRALDRVNWGKENISELRSRLTSNTILLNTFVTNCTQDLNQNTQEQIQSSKAEIQHAMGEIQTMLRKGLHRRNSTSSLRSIASFAKSVNSKETWKQLCRDLHKVGVTADMISEKKHQIVNLFQSSSPPVVVEEIVEVQRIESSTSLGSSDADLSKDAKTGKNKRNLSLKLNWAPLINTLTGPLLVAAAKSGDVNAVKLRLSIVGNLEYKDTNNYTALGWAAANGHIEVVQLLLEKGANIEAIIGNTGKTALCVAVVNGHMPVVGLLLRKGAKMEAVYRDIKVSLVTGEKVVRAEDIAKERGSIIVGSTLTQINSGMIIELETLDTSDYDGNIKPNFGAQRALNELKTLLHRNKEWEGNASGLAKALVKTMELTLNTLLPPTVMNSNLPLNSGIGSVNSAPGPTPLAGVYQWAADALGRMWHWPLVVQMEVNSDDGPKMEEQTVRISFIQRAMGGWFVMKEGVEALLELWLFTLKQRRLKYIKYKRLDHANMQPAFSGL
ncbi:hypothetical protein EV426DRAFT_644774 [Tirmania nivea]|nr:hypothetical protein EV426DRAFT_644774 [Tirmania nivea]